MPKPICEHRNEYSVRDAPSTQEVRNAVETQIFDDRVFRFEDHHVLPKGVNEEEEKPRWGYHPVNNSLDIINPFAIVQSRKYVYRNWAELRASAITDQEAKLEQDIVQLRTNVLSGSDIGKDTRDRFLTSIENLKSSREDTVKIVFPESSDFRLPENLRHDDPNQAIPTPDEKSALVEFARRVINALIIRRVVKRVRVCGSWTNNIPSGFTDSALIFIGQNHYLPPNPQVFIIPIAGHVVYPDAWRAQRLWSLTRRPFNECVHGNESSKFKRPTLMKPLVDPEP